MDFHLLERLTVSNAPWLDIVSHWNYVAISQCALWSSRLAIVVLVLHLTVLKLSAVEGRGNQNQERLAQRTHWYADPQIKHIYSLTRFTWDFGTITILYSQPVAALQILTKEGAWKWVKHIKNALVSSLFVSLPFGQFAESKGRLSTPVTHLNSYLEDFTVLQSIGIAFSLLNTY